MAIGGKDEECETEKKEEIAEAEFCLGEDKDRKKNQKEYGGFWRVS